MQRWSVHGDLYCIMDQMGKTLYNLMGRDRNTHVIETAVVEGRDANARKTNGERGESSERTRFESPSHGERNDDQVDQ